jgi:hypothetical protein
MPEWRECFAHLLQILTLFMGYKSGKVQFRLVDIYTELPVEEAQKAGLCQDGKVLKITSDPRWKTVTKGNGVESSLLAPPPLFEVKADNGFVRAAALSWNLDDVKGNGRSMLLIFDKFILKVSAEVLLPYP